MRDLPVTFVNRDDGVTVTSDRSTSPECQKSIDNIEKVNKYQANIKFRMYYRFKIEAQTFT